METRKILTIVVLALCLMVWAVAVSRAGPMGTGFTYQGSLNDGGSPANGLYDFTFALYDDPCRGLPQASTIDVNDVQVMNGYFTVELDFDGDAFDGEQRWLDVGVRPGDFNDPPEHTFLSPRTEMTPVPYALQTRGISVDSDGNVGIGTTDPQSKLSVVGGGMEVLAQDSGEPVSISSGLFGVLNSNQDTMMEVGESPSEHITFYNNLDVVMSMKNGNVGIGTDSASGSMWPDSTTLEIAGNAPSIVLDDQVGMYQEDFEISNGGDKVIMRDATDSINIMTIALTGSIEGNVGIGTTNPLSNLSVGGEGESGVGVYGVALAAGLYGEALYVGVVGKAIQGVHGEGSSYGVYGLCNDDFDLNVGVYANGGSSGSNNAYAVQGIVSRDGTGTYYSGHFSDDGVGGSYLGLYADVRTGDSIDIAEYILDTYADTGPGDVLVADPDNNESVVKANKAFDSSVMGIVSTKPHMVMGMELIMDEETGEMYEDVDAAQLSLAGRVPVKITDENGPIQRGDMLTTSSTPGHAMKWTLIDVAQAQDFEELKSILAENETRRNAILGKALEPHESGDGKIIALLSLQ